MNSNILISIILPVYNCKKYINKSVNSVLLQDYKNFELIIINDGSDDGTKEEINKIQDQRIIFIQNNTKLGLSNSLNIGIDKSLGDFICRMDGDDIMHPKKLSLQMSYMLNNQLHFCGTWIKFFDAQKKNIKYPVNDVDIRFFMMFGCPFAHPSVLFKKSILNNNKYENRRAEDYNLWSELATDKKIKFGNLPKFLLFYRRHDEQKNINLNLTIKDSKLISKKYSLQYLNNPDLYHIMLKYSFGMNKSYTFLDYIELSESIIKIAKKNKVSNTIILQILRSIFFKLNIIKISYLFIVLKLIYSNSLSLFNINVLYIILIYFYKNILNKKS